MYPPLQTNASKHRPLITIALLVFALNASCDTGADHAGHSHGDEHDHGAQTDAHDHHAPTHTKTAYDSGYEVFAQFPPLVVGEHSTLAIHITKLDGYEPADAGSVAVVLTSDTAPGERFEADNPTHAGLYKPVAHPEHTGTRQLFVVYRNSEATVRFSLGELEVHASHPEEPPSGEHDGGIQFSKEQQWKVDFATGMVEPHKLQPSVPAQGIVRPAPNATARLRAPFAGRLMEPKGGIPDIGTRVDSGQPLALIAPTVDANALPMLRADLSKAKTKRKRRRREIQRLEGLVEQGAIPRKRLLDAKSKLEAAQAEVEAARQRVDQYQSFDRGGGGGAVVLRAPVAGTVTARPATSGEYLEPGDLILRTTDQQRLRLEVRIAAANADRIDRIDGVWFEQDEDQTVELSRSDERFFARIETIDPATRTSSAWFEIPSELENLVPGQYRRVHVRTGKPQERRAVPSTALLEEKGMWVAYVMTGPESFERRTVQIGVRDGAFVEITEGLESGERIVTRGAYYVKLASTTSGIGGHHH